MKKRKIIRRKKKRFGKAKERNSVYEWRNSRGITH